MMRSGCKSNLPLTRSSIVRTDPTSACRIDRLASTSTMCGSTGVNNYSMTVAVFRTNSMICGTARGDQMGTTRKTITVTEQQDNWIKAQIAVGAFTLSLIHI